MTVAARVQTVLGPIRPEDLGVTLMHEHVLASMASHWSEPADAEDRAICREPLTLERLWRVRANPNLLLDNCELQDRDLALRELGRFRQVGGGTVVEMSSRGLARDPAGLVEIARSTGLHVVCGTGYYVAASHPKGTADRSADDLAGEMVEEIRAGIAGTAVRAGAIGEIGVSEPMAPAERTVLRAAARAHAATGALVVIHPGAGPASIVAVADLLEAEGVPPARVVLGHAEERLRGDLDAMRRLLHRGFTLGFDTFGRDLYMPWRRRQHPSDAQRIEALAAVVAAGFARQVVLSQDLAWKHELTAFGGYGYAHVLRTIVPRLRDAGVAAGAIEEMLVANPRRLLPLPGATDA
jgi:phosphotriesterase-related protein